MVRIDYLPLQALRETVRYCAWVHREIPRRLSPSRLFFKCCVDGRERLAPQAHTWGRFALTAPVVAVDDSWVRLVEGA